MPTSATLRRRLRWQRPASLVLLATPALLGVALDVWRRGDRLADLSGTHLGTYAASVVESLVLWALLLYAALRQRGIGRFLFAGLFLVSLTFSFGGQQYFFDQYNAYLNVDVSKFASNFTDSVINQLLADIGNYVWAKLPFFVLGAALIVVGRRVLRPRRRPARVAFFLAPVALVATFFIPTQHRHAQASVPDVLYLHGVGGLIRTQLGFTEQSNQLRPRERESLEVGKISTKPPVPRNVMLLILESVRADATCVPYDPSCIRTAATNRLAPERYPLRQVRSLASSTAISLAVLWAGIGPHESRDVLHTWPVIFDYANAAGWDTAFWTSQNMMFGNARLWVKDLGARKFISATDIDPTCDLDMGAREDLLAEHVNREIDDLKEPFLAVVQFSNVHYPYYVDEKLPQPFQPATTSKAADTFEEFWNHYKNSVHQQDIHVASILEHLRASEVGNRTVVVYTSDHAEAFREHGQTGHTFSVLDEEIKVPGWVDAPRGTLTEDESKHLTSNADEFVFHPDIAVTVMDLMGVWDAPELEPFKSRIIGDSLLRGKVHDRAMPLTNCAGVWSCAFENWGYMKGSMKLEARSWDKNWSCFNLADDPLESTDLGIDACRDLHDLAMQTFGRLPGRAKDE